MRQFDHMQDQFDVILDPCNVELIMYSACTNDKTRKDCTPESVALKECVDRRMKRLDVVGQLPTPVHQAYKPACQVRQHCSDLNEAFNQCMMEEGASAENQAGKCLPMLQKLFECSKLHLGDQAASAPLTGNPRHECAAVAGDLFLIYCCQV